MYKPYNLNTPTPKIERDALGHKMTYAVSPHKHAVKVMFQYRSCLLSNCGVDKNSVNVMNLNSSFLSEQLNTWQKTEYSITCTH